MNLLKKIFEKRRARAIRRAREKYFDMFVEKQLIMEYGDFHTIQDAADDMAAWLYGDTKSPCPSCAHTPQSSHCPG